MSRSIPTLQGVGCFYLALLGCVPIVASAQTRDDVLTAHGSRERTGWFPDQKRLSPAVLSQGKFGKLWESAALDSYENYPARLYASPLYVDGLKLADTIHGGGTFRVVIAASSTGFVYAINTEAANGVKAGEILWKTHFDSPCVLNWDASAMGVISTPVIDKARKVLYVASCSVKAGWQVYGLDLASGAVLDGWPVSIHEDVLSEPSLNRNPFYGTPKAVEPRWGRFYIQRGALNLDASDRYLFVTLSQARGWLVSIDTTRKAVASSFSATPLPQDSVGGIWGSTGPAIDASGNVFVVTGASPQTGAPALRNWSQSVLMFSAMSGDLSLRGIYTPFNYCRAVEADIDLGGSGVTLIPSKSRAEPIGQLLALGGKQGNAYLLATSRLAVPGLERRVCSEDSASDLSLLAPQAQAQFGRRGPINIFGPYSDDDGMLDRAKNRAAPAYFRDAAGREYLFYTGNTKDPNDTRISIAPSVVRMRLQRPAVGDPYLRTDGAAGSFVLKNPGPPVVSSNGGKGAIVWILDENAQRSATLVGPNSPQPVLLAVDPYSLKVLWRTKVGELNTSGKYNSPTVARNTVFIGTDRIVAFGIK